MKRRFGAIFYQQEVDYRACNFLLMRDPSLPRCIGAGCAYAQDDKSGFNLMERKEWRLFPNPEGVEYQ